MSQNILSEIDAGIGIVTFNRPERHNAYDAAMLDEFAASFARMAATPGVRAVVLSGVGASVCAGADAACEAEEPLLGRVLQGLRQAACPVIARVQGAVCGGGLGVVAACDLAVAAFDARFAAVDPGRGLLPQAILPVVQEAIGPRHARRYLLTGQTFSAAEAYRIGLIHEMVADVSALDDAIGEWLDALLAREAEGLARCKERLRGE